MHMCIFRCVEGRENAFQNPKFDLPSSGAGAPASQQFEQEFDLLIIGGGINGAGIAREASRQGLAVCLVEKEEYGGGTSSKSSMLAHGGLRYLEQFEFKLVHEALQDREELFREFPDMVRPIRFIYPVYPNTAARRTMRVGLWLYDLLSHGKSVPKRQYLKKRQVVELLPGINPDGLKGAGSYWDGQFLDVPELIRRLIAEAESNGAVCLEHTAVTELAMEGERCVGAVVDRNGTPQVVKARQTINAAGPWVDSLLDTAKVGGELIRRTRGIHLVVPKFVESALIVRATDGRTFFVIPWMDYCLIGTTDTDEATDARYAQGTPVDIAYLQESVRFYFPDAPVDDVKWCYAGVRPLVNEPGLVESSVTRRHVLRPVCDGLVAVQGGKLTTFPGLARDAVRLAP